MKSKIFLSLILFACLLNGDVMYEMITTTEGMMGMGSETVTRNFIKGERMRTEVITKNPVLGEVSSISIVRMDKNLIWLLDEDKKEYSEISLESEEKIEPIDTAGIIPEVNIQKCGEKKTILKLECEKYIVNMKVKSKEDTITIVQTMWVSQGIPGYEEITTFSKRLTTLAQDMKLGELMGIDQKSFSRFRKKISEIEGFPLETELNFIMTQEGEPFSFKTKSAVTKIDNIPISDRVFEIPTGYKRRQD